MKRALSGASTALVPAVRDQAVLLALLAGHVVSACGTTPPGVVLDIGMAAGAAGLRDDVDRFLPVDTDRLNQRSGGDPGQRPANLGTPAAARLEQAK